MLMRVFQYRYAKWMRGCFGADVLMNLRERNHRFCEESLELLQSAGYTKDDVLRVVDYVYSRPPSQSPIPEIGDVVGVLSALATAHNASIEETSRSTLERNILNTEAIRDKFFGKAIREPISKSNPVFRDCI